MRDILQLTRRDIRHATSNVMAVIVMLGLVVIPSLFTWFNVIASWDPFSNTKNLRVAVASADNGYQSDLVPLRINVGEQVLAELRANDDLDWVITSEDDAIDGTKSGAYYAALVLPASFSTDMMTFYTDGIEHTNLAYYTNEKKNALAPKITDQGAEGVSQQINQVFTETLSEVALNVVSSLSDYLTDADTQAALTRLEARVGGVSTQLRAGAQTADVFTSLLGTTVPLVDSGSSLITSSGAAFSDASSAVGGGAAAVDELGAVLASSTQSLSDAIARTASGYDAVGDRIDDLFAQSGQLSDAQVQLIDRMAGSMQDQIDHYVELRNRLDHDIRPQLPAEAQEAVTAVVGRIDAAVTAQQSAHDRVAQAAQDIADGDAARQTKHDEMTAAIAAAKQALQNTRDSYTGSLQPTLDELAGTLAVIDADVISIGGDLAAASARLSGSGGSLRDTVTGAQAATGRIAASLTDTASTFDRVEAALADAADTGDLSALSDIIGPDASVLATSLAQPLRVDRTAVFPIVSFGAGMAPLYTVLALWVGALLMTVAIRVDVNAETLPDRPELSLTRKYFGRYGIFALLGLAQSTLVTLGLIVFIQVEPEHPFLLILAGWVASLVFTLLIYTAVVALGNAGKALAVLVLVIQVSAAGGAYPVQLLPQWFQSVSPFLPATHAVAAMRSAIAGAYAGDFWISLGMLALFVIPALLLGLVLRRPLISFTQGLSKALESTKLMAPA